MNKVVTLVVGYRTRAIDKIEELATTFAPGDAAWQQLAADATTPEGPELPKVSGFAASAAALPFFATFEELSMVDPYAANADKTRGKYRYWRHDPEGEKPPVAVRFREYLRTSYPEAWHDENRTVFRFVAFDAELFARVLAFDCARPGVRKPIPFATWNEDMRQHVSLVSAAVPPGMAGAQILEMFKLWKPAGELSKNWEEFLDTWPEYNQVPRRDALVATEIAGSLGVI